MRTFDLDLAGTETRRLTPRPDCRPGLTWRADGTVALFSTDSAKDYSQLHDRNCGAGPRLAPMLQVDPRQASLQPVD